MADKKQPRVKRTLWTRPDGSDYESPAEEYIFSPLGFDVGLQVLGKKWEVPHRTIVRWSGDQEWVKRREIHTKALSIQNQEQRLAESAEHINKIYKALRGLWNASIIAIQGKFVTEGKVNKLSANEIHLYTQALTRVTRWALLLEGVNVEDGQGETAKSQGEIFKTMSDEELLKHAGWD